MRVIVFFASADEMRDWFETHHDSAFELWAGIRERRSGGGGVTLAEALDQATGFGWVHNMTWRTGEDSFMVRFTPGPRNTGRAEGRRSPCEAR